MRSETAIVRGRRARCRQQARCRRRAHLGAQPPRHQLAVVPPRRPVELRGRNLTRKVADGTLECNGRRALPRSKPPSTTAATSSRSPRPIRAARPPARPSMPAGTRRQEAESPEILDVALDQRQLQAGRYRQAAHRHKHGGKALISCCRTACSTQQVDIPKGGGEADLRSATTGAPAPTSPPCSIARWTRRPKRMPSRAIGVQWLASTRPRDTLKISSWRPRRSSRASTLTVPVKIAGLKPARRRASRVAAVDLGILNLTRFETPAPENWFYAQRRSAWRSATSTAASSTACAPSAARCARAVTAATAPACRAARRSKRRSPCSPASSRSAPTAPPASTSSCPTSTAR